MKKLILTIFSLLAVRSAMADQSAAIFCHGKNIILQQKTPYMGDDSTYTQSLFILKDVDNDSESKNTAYFLDISDEAAAGTTFLVGKNTAGGSFMLQYRHAELVDVGDGTIIHERVSGKLTYKHGSLIGSEENVQCEIR